MLPILVKLGPVAIYSLGFFLFLGFLLATFIVWKQARIAGLSEEKVLDSYFLTVFISIICGRLVHVYLNWTLFAADYSRIFLFLKYPGFTFPVIVITGIVVSGLLAKKYDIDVLHYLDVLGYAASFFAFFGYLGSFLDTNSGLWPLVLTVVLLVLMIFLRKKFLVSASLSELAKKRGIFFLCYLIFQLVSLLMTAWSMFYFGALVLVISIFVIRYKLLFKYVYDSISQRRPRAN